MMMAVNAACLTGLFSGYKANSPIPVVSAIPVVKEESIGHELSELDQGMRGIALVFILLINTFSGDLIPC
jgi:hypothetical protein